MDNVEFIPIRKEDIEYISTHLQDTFECSWDEIQFRQEACSCSSSTYVALHNNISIGFVSFKKMYDQIDIMNICVDKQYRLLGIGHKLLDIVFEKAVEDKMVQIMLEVNVNNVPAIELYKKVGFDICSVRKSYYVNKNTNVKEDAYIMIFKEE